jgi:hypothetical protein
LELDFQYLFNCRTSLKTVLLANLISLLKKIDLILLNQVRLWKFWDNSVTEIDFALKEQASAFGNFWRPGSRGYFRNGRPMALRHRFSPGLPLSVIFHTIA